MLDKSAAFSGYSVTDLQAAKEFYADKLGLNVDGPSAMGMMVRFPNGHTVFLYPKPDHKAADFTVLNFPVEDIDAAVDQLRAKDIAFIHYDDLPVPQDEKEILRGRVSGYGPDIAWFRDPAGNILSVLQN